MAWHQVEEGYLTSTSDPHPFELLQALDQPARREWLRGWMLRMGLATAHQAAPVLCHSRRTLERMTHDQQAEHVRIGDDTIKLAWALERLKLTDRT